MTSPIDSSIEQLKQIEDAKQKHLDTLKSNRDILFSGNKDPGVMLMLILVVLLQSGPSLAPIPGGFKDPTGSTFVESFEDKLRETGVQKGVTNAFSSVLTDAQNAFNVTDGSKSTLDIRVKLLELRDGLTKLSGKDGSPFDKASITSINESIDKMIGSKEDFPFGGGGILKEIDGVGGLKALYDNAKKAGDTTGAANILKRATDQFGTLGTSTQTVSSMVTTKTNMVSADLQTMQGFLNSFVRALADQLKSFNKAPQ